MKYLKILFIIMMLVLILPACKNAIYKEKDEISVSKIIDYQGDRTREVYKISNINVDYDAIKCPTSQELYKNASLIIEGEALSSKTTLGPSGIANTLVTFKIANTYKGQFKEKTIEVAFIGGYVNAEDYQQNISSEEFPVKEGIDKESLKEEISGKILSLNIFPGENIPLVGANYLMFLGEREKFMGCRYGVIGMEYEQGLFEIQKGMVDEFDPNKRKSNDLINKVDLKLFIEAAKIS
ncbi:MAG: hypothetical protein FD141_590 [Fusobacteria bacterium]|nr:MAG: hypothetical protein FD141_590 [Fusobacteriota bacterium]KAF0228744.1 MAG: hypothetical protein FD182_1000 [Fusobacteriota bacterium]